MSENVEERFAALETRMTAVENHVRGLQEGLAVNTNTTNAVKNDTAELLSLFKASKLGVAFIKWFATVGVPIATLFAAMKGWIKAP